MATLHTVERLETLTRLYCSFDCANNAGNAGSYEAKLVAVCTPPGGIQGIPDADSVQRLLAQIPRLDAINVTAAFAMRLQDEAAQRNWQVRAKALVLMQMLVEIKPFAGRYLPAFQANASLLQQLEALRTGIHKQVIREGARKLLSLIRSNGTNPVLIPKGSPTAKPHIRHVQLRSADKKAIRPAAIQTHKAKPSPSNGKVAMNKVFRPVPVMSKGTSLVIQEPRPSLVMSPKVSQAVQASWRRRNSIQKPDQDDANLMPFQKILSPVAAQSTRSSWIYGAPVGRAGVPPAPSSITVGASNSSRYDSGRVSAFSFVQ